MPIDYLIGFENSTNAGVSYNPFYVQRSVYAVDRIFESSRADSVARAAGSCHCGNRAHVQVSAGLGNCFNNYL